VPEHLDVSPLIRGDRWAASVSPPASKPTSMRVFGVVMLIGFGAFAALSWWTYRRTGVRWRATLAIVLALPALGLFVWSLVAPRRLQPVYRAWMAFGQGLGAIVSGALLIVVYYLVVTPVGWLMRATGTDPLSRATKRAGESYWVALPTRPDRDDYTHLS
jgi:hypothetical protein